MRGYTEVVTQADMEALLDRMASFHDSLLKEIHFVNRGFVEASGAMVSGRFDMRVLVQSQWQVRAVELLFVGVESLENRGECEFWAASGHVVVKTTPGPSRQVVMSFDSRLKISAERLFFCDRVEWHGAATRFGGEVPHPDCVSASVMFDDWRQCTACADGFEAPVTETYVLCRSCGAMTELDRASR